ncbi:MAG TPA: ABC transporter permease [Actinomycetes bacterium]|nr:ABC transporter permease [Actinomycetes bacterium]
MSLRETLRFALLGLNANRLRTALTTLGILIGVAAVIILVAVGNGSSVAIQKSLTRLGTNSLTVISGQRGRFGPGNAGNGAAATTRRLTVDDALALADPDQAPDIKSVAPVVQTQASCAYAGTSHTTTVVGTWPAYFEASNSPVSSGTYISDDDVVDGRRTIVLGQTVVDDLFGTVDPVGQTITCGGVPFDVVGVLKTKGTSGFLDADDTAVAPLSTVQNSLAGYGALSQIVVEAKSSKAVNAAQSEIQTVMDARHKITSSTSRDYQVLNQASLLATSASNNRVFTVLLGAVAAISLLVGGIGITNIMLVTVAERTREIGIRKAIGAPRRAILGQFLIEATLLSVIGGALGVLVGLIGSTFRIVGVDPVVVPSSILLAFGVSVAIGLFFGSYPASRAASMRPIDALRYE